MPDPPYHVSYDLESSLYCHVRYVRFRQGRCGDLNTSHGWSLEALEGTRGRLGSTNLVGLNAPFLSCHAHRACLVSLLQGMTDSTRSAVVT